MFGWDWIGLTFFYAWYFVHIVLSYFYPTLQIIHIPKFVCYQFIWTEVDM